MTELLLTAVVSLAFGGIGAYVGAYLREKGKNLATKEDLDRVVRATEEIKAEVASLASIRTRKRELQIEVMKDLANASTHFFAVAMGSSSAVTWDVWHKMFATTNL